MKTRFAPLVALKHSQMQKSESLMREASARLQKAREALEESLRELKDTQTLQNGNMKDFLAQRALVDAQLRLIEKNRQWVAYEEAQVAAFRTQLKADTIEYEKFKYVETQEIREIQKKIAKAEAKRLDDVAMMTFKTKETI